MRRVGCIALLIWVACMFGVNIARAQQPISIKIKNSTVCYAHTQDNPCYVPPPEEFQKFINGARKKSSTFEVNYNPGFSPEAEAAFNYAIGIWESLISSSVPIKIEAYWSSLNPGTLGGANFTSAWANFSGAQKLNVFYPIALVEKITGQNFNGNDPEIFIQFNNAVDWHYDPTSPPPAGQYDIVTVLLHEIGHGLGFSGTFRVTGETGNLASAPYAYDVPIENHLFENLIRSYQSPSTDLAAQLTGNNLFSNTQTSNRPKLFAPETWSDGSSISHVDEFTYNNTADALMTPQIAPSERIHNPGIALNMLKDIGWEMVRIDHQRIIDRENVVDPFIVTTKLIADNGYNAGSIKLHYTTNGTTFTTVDMSPTGIPDEYSGTIPATGSPQEYGYYLSVLDNIGREFVNPGKIVRKLNSELQGLFEFETGPDVKAPTIVHEPKPFLLDSETSVTLEARVSDNIGIATVMVEYSINNITQTPQPLLLTPPEEDSVYTVTLNLGLRTVGDEILYRLIATDNSSNSNQAFSPANEFYTLNVVGLEPTQDSYFNTFNTPSSDFFGNGFSIAQPSGFNDPAIHTTHPYLEGTGFPNDQNNFIYQLKIPVRIKKENATLVFDEIVLVEPGENGTQFGDEDFYDYVVVEGSKDGGVTWITVADGYDSRANSVWLTRYNSAISGNNSAAVGDPSLYHPRNLNLQDRFNTGDEVVIRFRLFSDPFAAGWGWAIDNLKIQIDDTPPLILNDHIDYMEDDDDALVITMKASDASGVESMRVEYRVDNGLIDSQEIVVNPPSEQYTFSLGISTLPVGTLVEYRIVALDSAGNEGTFPPSGDFIQVPIIDFESPVSTYASNFNSANTDFIGNFFSIAQPAGFTDGAIHSTHSYPNGIGLDKTSSFNYILKKPITISAENSLMRFDEIVIIEGHAGSAAFGTPAFNDYVIVEGSVDGGITWSNFLDGYDIVGGLGSWITAFNSGGSGDNTMFRTRVFDLTANGNFLPGNQVLIRFRLYSNETINGWGWAIDNLYIQDPITSVETPLTRNVNIYPNPITENRLTILAENISATQTQIELITTQGQKVHSVLVDTQDKNLFHQIDVSGLPAGMYLVYIHGSSGEKIIRKIIKTN